MKANSEDRATYHVGPTTTPDDDDDATVARALAILNRRVKRGATMGSPSAVGEWLCLHLAEHERELFGVLWLDAQHRVICAEDLFFGTLTQTTVYPREIVRAALAHNAGAAVLYHNHPSGTTEPSEADKRMTRTIQEALAVLDVQVLDHLVVAGGRTTSFAARGLL